MKCDMQSDMLTAYYDGEATPETASLVSSHLSECAHCRALLQDWQELRDRLSSIGRVEIKAPPELRLNVMQALAEDSAPKRQPVRRGLLMKGLSAAAALILMSGATWGMLSGDWQKKMPVVIGQEPTIQQKEPINTNPPETATVGKPGVNAADNGQKAIAPEKATEKTPEVTRPKEPQRNNAGDGGTAIAQDGGAIANNRPDRAAAAFISTEYYTYSGYLHIKDAVPDDIVKRVKSMASGYAADVTEKDNIIRLDVPTDRYNAFYDDLSSLLAETGNGRVTGKDSKRISLDKDYKEALAALGKVKEEMAGDNVAADRLGQLRREENRLLDQKEALEQRAITSVIVIKLN